MNRAFLLFLFAATLVFAQGTNKKQLTARELFYAAAQAPAPPPRSRPPVKAAPHTTPPKVADVARADTPPPAPQSPAAAPATAPMPVGGAPPLGLRYTVLRLAADNSAVEVSPDTVFHSGDRIRFAIEANAPGYLYIINQGSSGTWKPMFPSAEIEDGNNKIEGWRPYTMPPRSRLAFDTTAGTENLFIVFSREPEADLESMVYSLQGKKKSDPAPEAISHSSKDLVMAASISNSAVERIRASNSRDLIVEKVDPSTPGDKKETAVYVVNPTGSADSRVVADLHLVHQ
uniref:DUF4384 domain-containing protein n=1 Tax=Solibacter usitatus (strain Ellin6076) TaxID=234267 RepID=Q01TV1_SOLUE